MMAESAPNKSVVVAYVLLALGWWCGAHHWYLERTGQAFLWMSSFGMSGIGAVLDVFLLKGYVDEANGTYLKGERGFSLWAYIGYQTFAGMFTAGLMWMGELPANAVGIVLALPALAFGRKCLGPPRPVPAIIAVSLSLMMIAFSTSLSMMVGMSVTWMDKVFLLVRAVVGTCQATLPHEQLLGRSRMPMAHKCCVAAVALFVIVSSIIHHGLFIARQAEASADVEL